MVTNIHLDRLEYMSVRSNTLHKSYIANNLTIQGLYYKNIFYTL
jgi:hypothetical protein